MSEAALRRTPLYDRHLALGAKMVPFSGWEMPVRYQSVMAEHRAVRSRVGAFDISHMGKFVLRGANVREQLERIVPSSLAQTEPGHSRYTVLLNDRGGIVDDLILYNQGQDSQNPDWERWMTIVNAATTAKDWSWMQQHLPDVTLEDLSGDRVLLAIQGPQAVEALQSFVRESLREMPRFGHATVTLSDRPQDPVFAARTGYTGEDGFEVMLPPKAGLNLWDRLLEAEVIPIGLGARDTLRLEAALHLYGQDMDDDTTPLEAGLSWLVDWSEERDYIGKSALVAQKQAGVQRRLVGLVMNGREIARPGYEVVSDGTATGQVVSGTQAPTLGKAIALAYVPPNLAKVGTDLSVKVRDRLCPATVVKRPFYKVSATKNI
ncbi:MAG: glycine cleavage system aminomethyltransferase GcvT [Cyanobacteria bacterium J06639_1]